MIHTSLHLLAAYLGGVAAGWGYFDGLRRTVLALPRTARPALLLSVSLLLRLTLLLGGAWLLLRAGGGWPHLLAALLGLVSMRQVLLRRHGPADRRAPTQPGGLE